MTYLAKHEKSRDIFPHASMVHVPLLGSHDSATFGIHATSELAADLPDLLKKLPKFLNATARRHIATWSKTQHLNLFHQLERFGCRYLDLRVCPHFPTEASSSSAATVATSTISTNSPFTLWLTHGSFSVPLDVGLEQIVDFLEGKGEHNGRNKKEDENEQKNSANSTSASSPSSSPPSPQSKNSQHKDENVENDHHKQHPPQVGARRIDDDENLEVVILDLQKITGFTESCHYVKLAEQIYDKLGAYLVPREHTVSSTPLKTLWDNGWRIFLLCLPLQLDKWTTALEMAAAQHRKTSSNGHGCPGYFNIISCLHPRNDLTIRSLWFDLKYKKDLVPKLERELTERAKSFSAERFQLHVLQAILSPSPGDMAVAFGTGGSGKIFLAPDSDMDELHLIEADQVEYSKRHSILDFAKHVNSDLITLWEDESKWETLLLSDKNNLSEDGNGESKSDDDATRSFFVYRTLEDLKRSRPVGIDLSDRSETTEQQQKGQQQSPLPSNVAPLGFDPRNIFMIDFVEIGTSRKTGRNAFEVCFDLACRRFGVVENKDYVRKYAPGR